MADATHKLGANFRDKIIKMAALRLSDDADGATTSYIEIIPGTGVPSGAYHLDAGVVALYVRDDASGADDLLYYTVDGGTGWAAFVLDAQAAAEVSYDNAASGLTAATVQAAVDEVEGRVDGLEGNLEFQAEDLGAAPPAAKSTTAVHAIFAGNDGSNDFPGAFSDADVPRSLQVDFQASWDGGNVNVVGTDQFDQAVNEDFVANPGSSVLGSKIFKTVVSATKGAVGVNAAGASIGTHDTLGLSRSLHRQVGTLAVAGVNEVGTWSAITDSVTPTTAPDGSKAFAVLYPVAP